MTIAACAKVNFTLEVLGVRPDGYHDLRSVVVPVSLADEVTLEPADGVTLKVKGGGAIKDLGAEDNLAVRAVRLMQRVSGRKDGVAIALEKRIPVGGGLGGGSADAAAVLNGLNEMWGLDIPRKELAALGAEIGSDVPALVLGGPVLMEGRGERVAPLFPLPSSLFPRHLPSRPCQPRHILLHAGNFQGFRCPLAESPRNIL